MADITVAPPFTRHKHLSAAVAHWKAQREALLELAAETSDQLERRRFENQAAFLAAHPPKTTP